MANIFAKLKTKNWHNADSVFTGGIACCIMTTCGITCDDNVGHGTRKYECIDHINNCKLFKLVNKSLSHKMAGCACAGNAGNVFPATNFKGNG